MAAGTTPTLAIATDHDDREHEVYAVLAGGVGAARFLRGLTAVVPPERVVAVVNVGDDLDRLGLRICPDLDSVTYWLAGVVDPERQWGRAEESYTVSGELERFGHQPWFTLGDRDLATHVHRSQRLAQGLPLSEVTAEITRAFGLDTRVLPVTDDRVETRITTRDGRELHFQDYWVRERAAPEVAGIGFAGAGGARPAPGVVESVLDAEAVFVAPSNPAVSIDPVLAVPGMREAVRSTTAPVVGVSPIVGGRVVRGMADRLLPALGVEVSAAGVAGHYRDLLDAWVVDDRDRDLVPHVNAEGIRCVATDTLMDHPEVAAALARTCLELAGRLDPEHPADPSSGVDT